MQKDKQSIFLNKLESGNFLYKNEHFFITPDDHPITPKHLLIISNTKIVSFF